MKWWALLGLLLLSACHVGTVGAPENFHQVDGLIWRSAQPKFVHARQLEAQGFTDVLSLRRLHDDQKWEKSTSLRSHHVPMRAGHVNEKDICEALRVMDQARGKLLVHCWHGADRTGAVIASYRMVRQGWSADRAIAELHQPQYGHHANIYPEIETFLRQLDVAKIRRQLAQPEQATTAQVGR